MIGAIARLIFTETKLPAELWPWVTNLSIWIYNRLPQRSLEGKSPLEALNNWLRNNRSNMFESIEIGPPNLSNLKRPGYRAYPLRSSKADEVKRVANKVLPKTHIGYFVGYKSSSQYYIWIPQKKRVIDTPHVTFNENEIYRDDLQTLALPITQQESQFLTATIEDLLKEVREEYDEAIAAQDELLTSHLQLGTIHELYGRPNKPIEAAPYMPYEPLQPSLLPVLMTPEPTPEPD